MFYVDNKPSAEYEQRRKQNKNGNKIIQLIFDKNIPVKPLKLQSMVAWDLQTKI